MSTAITEGMCGRGVFALHPDGPDRYTEGSIETAMADVASLRSLQELKKFWLLRRQCAICQSVITQDAPTFAQFCRLLLYHLSRINDGVTADANHITPWAIELHSSRQVDPEARSPGLLGSGETHDLFIELAELMLTPFDPTAARAEVPRKDLTAL